VSAPSRTLLDLADMLPLRDLERLLEEAMSRRLVEHDDLRALLERSPGRHGVRSLRALLEREVTPAFTRSQAEERLLALLRAAELSPTDVNVRVGDYEVDFLWRRERLVVEVDGYAFHNSRAAFERDRQRDAELQAAGYRAMRITWRQLTDSPEAVIARLARALTQAPAA
jgi:very-short-patch-repair endonuclease